MFKLFESIQAKISTAQWVALTVAALLFNNWSTDVLNTAYAASGFPVPYWEAQLSFDHTLLKGWYATLIEKQSLDLYRFTQYVDFVFIVSVLLLHVAALVVVSRMLPEGTRARSVMLWAALLSSLAPLLNAIENLVSFVMLAKPLDFSPWLAIVYSSFSAAKFAMFTFAYAAVILGLAWGLVCAMRRLMGKASKVSKAGGG